MADQSADVPGARKLGAYLFCSPAVIRAALRRQGLSLRNRRRGHHLGELLVEAGAITTEELDTAVHTQRMARLHACELFRSLNRTELAALAHRFDEVGVVAGQQFITEDEEDPTLYVIASGRLEVFSVTGEGDKVSIAEVCAPEAIGEMGYFAGGRRTASVRALEASELLRASYADLTHYFENVPHVAHAFMQVVERRRAETERRRRRRERAEATAMPGLEHLDHILALEEPRRLERGMERSIERLVQAAVTVTQAERGTLFLVDEAAVGLWSLVAAGGEIDEIRLPIGVGVAGWVAEHNEMANIIEAYEDERFNAEIDRRTGFTTHTILCAPVRGESGSVVGVMQVLNKGVGAFTEDDEALLRAFCEEVAGAVRNLEVYRRTMADYHVMSAMLSVTTALAEATELGPLSARLGPRIARIAGCARCDVLVADYERDELWSAHRIGGTTVTNRFTVAELPAGVAAVDGAAVAIEDTADEPGYDRALDERLGLAVENLMAVPVHDPEGQIVGVLQAVNKAGGAFGPTDEALLRALAVQIGRSPLLHRGG